MAARTVFEPTTLRLKGIDSTNAPPRPTLNWFHLIVCIMNSGELDIKRKKYYNMCVCLRPPSGLHMQDLESSLYYSLWAEIPSRVSFDSESLGALKRYINILAKV